MAGSRSSLSGGSQAGTRAAYGAVPVSMLSGSCALGVPPVAPASAMRRDASAALSADDGLEEGESSDVPDDLFAAALAADEGFEQEDLMAAAL